MKNLLPEMASVGAREKSKCSRNKRKFRQDPPSLNQAGGEDSSSAGFPAGFTTASESHGTHWEPRSAEAGGRKSSTADSSRKEGDSGMSLAPSKANEPSKLNQEQLKLMRWHSARKGSQAGDTSSEGRSEHRTQVEGSEGCEAEDDREELDEAEWDDYTEGQLEQLLLASIDGLYKEAICKIEQRGHNADDALKAVLRQGRSFSGKDAVSNIVESALVYLSGNKSEVEKKTKNFADLNELQRSGIVDMVQNLRKERPQLSRGDAMWCLLMWDMDITHVSPTEENCSQNAKVSIASAILSSGQIDTANKESPQSGQSKTGKVKLPKASLTHNPVESALPVARANSEIPPSFSSSTTTPCLSLPPVPSASAAKGSPLLNNPKLSSVPSSKGNTSIAGELLSTAESSKTTSSVCDALDSSSKKDKKKALKGEKILPTATSNSTLEHDKQSSNVGKVSTSSNVSSLTTKDQESSADSCPVAGNRQFEEIPSKVGVGDKRGTREVPVSPCNSAPGSSKQQPEIPRLATTEEGSGHQKPPDASLKISNLDSGFQDELSDKTSDSSTTAVTSEKSVSMPGKLAAVEERTLSESVGPQVCRVPASAAKSSASADSVTRESKSSGQTVKEVLESLPTTREKLVTGRGDDDQRDQMILKLMQRRDSLELQLQKRNEWANKKVMEAVKRLTRDSQELRTLRLEREEANRLKKEKQVSEDSATKKQADLETALRKASGQADRANATVSKLQAENAELRAEMEAAKLSAAESTAACQELAKRERKYTKRAQAWEKQKAKLQEELTEEKKKYSVLQQQLLVYKERLQQAEVRWRQEEKAKEEATLRADSERRAREQADAAAKRREESLRRKAESNYQRHRDDIQRLECEISQLRTTAEAAQLATSRWGPGVAVTPHMMELSNMQSLKETNLRLHRELLELQEMSESMGRRDVRRDRECVMCMCEEMSVVFLPCAHQVVCVKCNELHEKQGMRDCPSCRTHIQQRIRVFGVSA